MPIVGLKST